METHNIIIVNSYTLAIMMIVAYLVCSHLISNYYPVCLSIVCRLSAYIKSVVEVASVRETKMICMQPEV